jgi:helicase required for RNAi-mediated heterochromatin assembly 1
MNEDLIERFSRNRRADAGRKEHSSPMREKLNWKVQEYFQPAQKPLSAGPWLHRPELPTSAEVLDIDGDSATSDVVEIAPNEIEGPWESKGESSLGIPPSRYKH